MGSALYFGSLHSVFCFPPFYNAAPLSHKQQKTPLMKTKNLIKTINRFSVTWGWQLNSLSLSA
jgi:hypothetical protein